MPAAMEIAARASMVLRIVVIGIPLGRKALLPAEASIAAMVSSAGPTPGRICPTNNVLGGRAMAFRSLSAPMSWPVLQNHTLITLCLRQLLAACRRLAKETLPGSPKRPQGDRRWRALKGLLPTPVEL